MDYDKMLERAYSLIPAKKAGADRFEIPIVEAMQQGNKTMIRNFDFITGKLRRDPKMMMKYFTKELAIPATHEGSQLILHGKFTERVLNQCLKDFVDSFVLCKECGKPDTNIVDGGHAQRMLVCEACGARAPVKG